MTSPAFAKVKAYVNQASIYEGNPITLKIETTQRYQAKPDLSVLKKDFIVLSARKWGTKSLSMNGQYRTFSDIWTIELQPNRSGVLKIPSIKVGTEKTDVLTLKIIDLPPEVTAETKKHVFIETSIGVDGNTTFVQQQIPYTVKLFYDSTLQQAEELITPDINPAMKNAIVEQLGRDKRYQVTKEGKRFNVIEKNFVISPEKSGMLKIPEIVLKGRIALSGGDSQSLRRRMDETEMANRFFNESRIDQLFRDAFSGRFFNRRSHGPSKPFSIKGKSIKVDVLPVAKGFNGSLWLPAEKVVIKDSWARNPPQLKVGEPVTRILNLRIKGLAGSQIPDIKIPKPNKMKVYPEKAKFETITDGNTVYGIQNISITYIPDASGKVKIPELKVDWWDVKNKQQKTFVLPPWDLNIAPDLTKNSNEEKNQLDNVLVEKMTTVTDEKPNIEENHTTSKVWSWAWLMWVLAATSLVILINILRKYFMKIAHKKPLLFRRRKKKKELEALQVGLLKACQGNDGHTATEVLITYTQALWEDKSIQNLGMIAKKLASTHDRNIIKDLEKSTYGKTSQRWNGQALVKLIEQGLNKTLHYREDKQKKDGELTPLYPD